MKLDAEVAAVMDERFGHDNLIALATLNADFPAVRTVNAYYESGAFHIITHALSDKMQQINHNPKVAVCGDWFTGRGIGDSLGHIQLPDNAVIADKLRSAFSSWYSNGHINEEDPNTIILRIQLSRGVLFHHGTRYDIEF